MFFLTLKSNPEKGFIADQIVDDEIRALFNARSDIDYFDNWHEIIGDKLSEGQSFQEIRDFLLRLIFICDYLSDNYTASN